MDTLAFLAWFLFIECWIILPACAIIAVQNGQSRIWFSSVRGADFSAGSGVGGGPGTGVMGVGGPSYPQASPVYPFPQQQTTGVAGGVTYPRRSS